MPVCYTLFEKNINVKHYKVASLYSLSLNKHFRGTSDWFSGNLDAKVTALLPHLQETTEDPSHSYNNHQLQKHSGPLDLGKGEERRTTHKILDELQ